jgi:hypothetical protein
MWNFKVLVYTIQKIVDMVKVLNKYVKHQGQGHKVKCFGTQRKVLLQGTLIWNIKAVVPTNQKI